jgi:hypothetical protein
MPPSNSSASYCKMRGTYSRYKFFFAHLGWKLILFLYYASIFLWKPWLSTLLIHFTKGWLYNVTYHL